MNYLVIGDVHGCYHTLKKLLSKCHRNELLIFLGDYIDRGYFESDTLSYLYELKAKYPQTIFLRGNHEQMFIESYELMKNKENLYLRYPFLKSSSYSAKEIHHFFCSLPLYYENEYLFASHAGISDFPNNPEDPNDPCGFLWNRMPLKNINKLQLYGHTPNLSGPLYNEISNSWNLDTGACFNGALSAVKINECGNVIKIIKIKTIEKDVGMNNNYR